MSAERLIVQEVAPRDGLQIEPSWVATADKIALIDGLSALGFSRIEAGSFVSPKAVPMLRDGEAVFQGIARRPEVTYVALVPNLRGAQRALAAGADELNLVLSASQTHNRANMRMSCEQSLASFAEVVQLAKGQAVSLNGTVATTFGCPFEGYQPLDRILRFVDRLVGLGVGSIALADTVGMGDPRQVRDVCSEVRARFPEYEFALHLHNTRGMGLANVLSGLEAGITHYESSLGGLGGCPFAPGATGNVCTEDLVHMLHQMGHDTGVDLDRLIAAARGLPALVGHDVPGQVMKAGKSTDLHPLPPQLR